MITDKEKDIVKFEVKVAKKYVNLLNSANSRGKDFNLTLNDVRKLMKVKSCYFSKIKFVSDSDSEYSRTIDRLDNDKGYVKGNVVACTIRYNKIKSDITLKEIVNIFNGVKKLL